MKKTLIAFLFIVFCCAQLAYSGEKIVGNTPTGDAKLDRSLEALNKGAKENIRDFAQKLSRKYGISEETTDRLLKRVGMSPGDVYMTAKTSKISRRSVDDVVKEYQANQGKGWGVIAKKLGIKPGSKEFHELKNDDSGMLSEYTGKEKKEKAKKKKKQAKERKAKAKGKGKGKKNKPSEGDLNEAETGRREKKGFFERWFGGGKKDK